MRIKVGAEYRKNEICEFSLWSPLIEKVDLLLKDNSVPIPLEKGDQGYWRTTLEKVKPGTLYKFRIDGSEFPDPASRSQPEGVHSWSEVTSPLFPWTDDSWKGFSTSEMIIYELHTGTFTEEGTFQGIEKKLDHLLELGINTIEIMPVSQFPGNRNWGYDGVYPFAVQNSYGSIENLKQLINTCHSKGIAVLLDVVYNHMGPEGNYLSAFGPYFTEKYHTPWGAALNFDDEYSDGVRNFFIQNALMWLEEFHFDGLRLDAVHEIIDRGAHHFLQELSESVDELEKRTGRKYVLIAESDLNDARIVSSYDKGGYGLEAQWVDDFHHSVHTFLTGEANGYYSDYGTLDHLKKTLQQAFVYDGKYSSFRKKTVGNSPKNCEPGNFLVSLQNHDQVGNRMLGERFTSLVSFEALKLAAGVLLISPYVPMLFMGEEFAEKKPFQYFVSHTDPDLVKAVQEGRRKEFRYFLRENDADFPDPQSEDTFNNSKLNWSFESDAGQKLVFKYYKQLISHRKAGKFNAFRNSTRLVELLNNHLISITGEEEGMRILAIANFTPLDKIFELPSQASSWKLLLASADEVWGGPESYPDRDMRGNIKIAAQSIMLFEAAVLH